MVTQALGVTDPGQLNIERISGDFAKEAQLLLCSDGLTEHVDDPAIGRILANAGCSAQETVDTLVAAAEGDFVFVRPETSQVLFEATAPSLSAAAVTAAFRKRMEGLGAPLARVTAKKPIAAICHGPWTLIDAGVVKGKTLTAYKSVRIDLENAGAASVVDAEVKECQANGWTLITSRTPDDLPAFNQAIANAVGG